MELLLLGDEIVADCFGCVGDKTDDRSACQGTACSGTIVDCRDRPGIGEQRS